MATKQPKPLAKLARPRIAQAVPRPRLFRRLDQAGKRPVTWVWGPPGAGKTTLIATYLAARKLPGLWYQVDAGDVDVATFFYYLREAARHAAPRRRPLPLLTPEYLQGLPTFTRNFFRDLYARLKTPFALVFDNYQTVLGDAPLHEVLREGLEHVPPGGRIILISRSEPPAAFARLRASAALDLVTWADLRLTPAEARGVVRRVGSRRLSRDAIATLHEASDGWAAGLVLLLERWRAEGAAPAAQSPRTPQAVFDYFASEIFAKTDPTTQAVLLQTAFLPRVTATMAEALTGLPAAGRLLADLHRQNYFTTRTDAAEPVYQYHPLFRAFLLSRAEAAFSTERRAQVQRAAAVLLDAADQPEAAVALLREAEDWETLARVIQDRAAALLAQGRHQVLLEWLAALPDPLVAAQPWLLYWRGMARLPVAPGESRGDFEQALPRFRAQQDAAGLYSAWSACVETFVLESSGMAPLDQWIALLPDLRREAPAFPSEATEARVASAMFLALLIRQPRHPDITMWAERTLALARASSDMHLRFHAQFAWVWHNLMNLGDLAKAGAVVEEIRDAVRSRAASPILRLLGMVAVARYEWLAGAFAACRRTVAGALDLARETGVHLWDNQYLCEAVCAALGQGDHAGAGQLLRQIAVELPRARPSDVGYYHALMEWDALLRGDLPLAFVQAERVLNFHREFGGPAYETLAHVFSAHIHHERHEDRDAAAHVAEALKLARSVRSPLVAFPTFLTQAYLAFDRGRDGEGCEALAHALALGREHGYVNTYVWRPPVMAHLCAQALEAWIEVEYARHLIRRRGLVPEAPPLDVPGWPWPVQIFALGRFALHRDEPPVPFTGKVQRRPLALLKALLASGAPGVREEPLAEALWPEAEGDAAAHALATTLYRLRRLLGREDAVLRQEGQFSLNARLCWVDVWAFERLLGKIEELLKRGADGGEPGADLLRWTEQAAALYRGPFLSGEADAPGALALAERLQRRWLHCLGEVGRQFEQAGDWSQAAAWYERGLEVDDSAEALYRGLMAAYQRLGRRGEALALYQRCRSTLAAKLGIAPSPETEALHQALRAR